MLAKKLEAAVAGQAAAGAGSLGVEDVFSAFGYIGNSSTQKITNGIALASAFALEDMTFDGVRVYYNHNHADTVRAYAQYSNDNSSWTNAGYMDWTSGQTQWNDATWTAVTAKYWRLYFTDPGDGNIGGQSDEIREVNWRASGTYITDYSSYNVTSYNITGTISNIYDGNTGTGTTGINQGATLTYTLNGAETPGYGGLVWIKERFNLATHALFDTERGSGYVLSTNNDSPQISTTALSSFNNDGFSVLYPNTNDFYVNRNGQKYISWTFRKAQKFFDIVTYNGTGSAQNISHNLGSVPGCIIVKRTSSPSGYKWPVYHRGMGSLPFVSLNLTDSKDGNSGYWDDTSPTDAAFRVGTNSAVNDNGATYVAYLFAHDAGGFGDAGNESIIHCGSYTGDGTAGGPFQDLGWEPQWILSKRTDSTGNWILSDSMRPLGYWNQVSSEGISSPLFANSNSSEDSGGDYPAITSTGYYPTNQSGNVLNASGGTYIYIAIRKGNMKTPTDATKVFTPYGYTGNGTSSARNFTGNPGIIDTVWHRSRPDTFNWNFYDRARRNRRLVSNTTDSEVVNASYGYISDFALGDGYFTVPGGVNNENFNKSSSTYISWNFTRAKGFHDVILFQGQNNGRTVNHNLGVSPELVITKVRNLSGASWWVFHKDLGLSTYLEMNSTNAASSFANAWNPSATDIYFAQAFITSSSSYNVIAYLFASCPGVSKVGSYTGDGTNGRTIDCGFSNGARFILIKQASAVNAWNVWDTTRGIVSGNDSRLSLNVTDAELVAFDQVDPTSSGFIVNNTAATNASGSTYIYLAIA